MSKSKPNTFNNRIVVGTRVAMDTAARLKRVLNSPDIYDIELGSGAAIISADGQASLDAHEVQRIRESVDLSIFYIREEGIYVTMPPFAEANNP